MSPIGCLAGWDGALPTGCPAHEVGWEVACRSGHPSDTVEGACLLCTALLERGVGSEYQ